MSEGMHEGCMQGGRQAARRVACVMCAWWAACVVGSVCACIHGWDEGRQMGVECKQKINYINMSCDLPHDMH